MEQSKVAIIAGALPHWTEAFSGSGSGYGSGYGYGYGSGYGEYGSGYGDGYGYGEYGDGYGDGYGYGEYGDGYGYGSGYGYGYWYWRLIAARFAVAWEKAEGFIAFWKSDKDGLPSNGGHDSDNARVGSVRVIQGPLKLCTKRALHATLNPDKWKGDRLWIVSLKGEVAMAADKVGALEREILCEVTD